MVFTFVLFPVFQYIVVQSMWLTLHFLFWDYSDTMPGEEFTTDAIIAYLRNPDVAIINQLAVWGTVRVTKSTSKARTFCFTFHVSDALHRHHVPHPACPAQYFP